jgi:glutaredoxin 2
MTNWQEYIAGTNPTNALSYLKINLAGFSPGAALEFFAVSNKTYTLQYQTNLNQTSWPKIADIPAHQTNRTVTIFDSEGSANRYYRIATPQQP